MALTGSPLPEPPATDSLPLPTAGYRRLERWMHHLAFAGIDGQRMLAEVENRVFGRDLDGIAEHRPVFIAALPRAGTTVLLQLLSRLPDFAVQTYRDMPFVLCPMLWDRLARRFRKGGAAAERAHGDGLLIDYDSAEGFEEVLWMAFWPEKYGADRILPWTAADRAAAFERFFRLHRRKIIALRRHPGEPSDGAKARRYLAKNNASIARLSLLPLLCPGCRIVVPVRNPEQQVISLRRQHERFLHQQDPFIRRYMQWLGHFEFGATLRPIDFDGWLATAPDPRTDAFWFGYWIATYQQVLQADPATVILFDYDRACLNPRQSLAALAMSLDLRDPSLLLLQSDQLRVAPRRADGTSAACGLLQQARALHASLVGHSVGGACSAPAAAFTPAAPSPAGAAAVQADPESRGPCA